MKEPKMKRTTFLITFLALMAFAALPMNAQSFTACFAHHPQYISGAAEIDYSPACVGHDEPELDPVSSSPASARDLTWTAVLPANNTTHASALRPTFWFGVTVNDPRTL